MEAREALQTKKSQADLASTPSDNKANSVNVSSIHESTVCWWTAWLAWLAVQYGERGVAILAQEKEALQVRMRQADLASLQPGDKSKTVRMLAAYMDLGVRYKMVGAQQRASAELRGLRIQTRVTLGDHKV